MAGVSHLHVKRPEEVSGIYLVVVELHRFRDALAPVGHRLDEGVAHPAFRVMGAEQDARDRRPQLAVLIG